MEHKEQLLKRVYWGLTAVFILFHLVTAAVNFAHHTYFYAVMALGGILFVPAIELFWKVFRMEPSYSLNLMIAVFIILLYTIGVVLQGYNIPYYDKFCHTLSGVVTAFAGLLLFLMLKPEKVFRRNELPLGAAFSFLTAAAVAGIWEICEYVISLIFKNDPQRVVLSGVADTMWDMIVCMAGALLFCGYICLCFRKREEPFTGILKRITGEKEK